MQQERHHASEFIQGAKDGFNEALHTDKLIGLEAQKMDGKNLGSSYLVGFGAGFTEGTLIKAELMKGAPEIPFSTKVQVADWILGSYNWGNDGKYARLKDCIENIYAWDGRGLPLELVEVSRKYLEEKRLQRAIENIYTYYQRNYYLIACMEFGEKFVFGLGIIRADKQRPGISGTESRARRLELQKSFEQWLKHYTY